ncbi:hypothetical protein L1987_75508 [Smallanthus sonchifolius]|uniref:Uncharacterized protein n=1 Tax=Smallanthus sonchifolius TaxID=185202 RepID=A0ACB9A7D4_9ASTR|nr:hypothetical protein L1987_75508 [Smallanthus sonchifolius]
MASPPSPPPLNIQITIHAGEPSYYTGESGNTDRGVAYDVGFALIVLLFIIILIYASYMCNRIKGSRSPPPPPTTADSDTDDFHSVIISNGLEDDILSNFPTFVYSDAVKLHKVENDTETNAVSYDSGCAICLTEYESTAVVRLLPECRHWFHVSCIDVWLKVHPTCPVCRKSPLLTSTELT